MGFAYRASLNIRCVGGGGSTGDPHPSALAHSYFEKSLRVAGFSTRMQWRVTSFGAHSVSRSKSTASFAFSLSFWVGNRLVYRNRAIAANDGPIYRRRRLGGMLNFYSREAA